MKTERSAERRRTCHPGEESDKVKIDKEFEALIPPLSPSELLDLHRSLEEEKGVAIPSLSGRAMIRW